MPGGLGPRFVLEAGFLILLAGVAAYARLDTVEIILVMAGGWLLVSLFEVLAAWRERLHLAGRVERVARQEVVIEAEAAAEEPSPRRSWLRRSPVPAEAAAEPASAPAEPASAPAEVVQEAPVEPAVTAAPVPAAADDEATGEIDLPKPRRWLRRREAEEPAEAEPPAQVARPSARHVRLIPSSGAEGGVESRPDAEAGP